jgi:transcription antitermination factor NusG
MTHVAPQKGSLRILSTPFELPKSYDHRQTMWCILRVAEGREKNAVALINKVIKRPVLDECFILQYETMKRFKGQWEKRIEMVYPNYIFLVTHNADILAREMRKTPALSRLLRGGGGRHVYVFELR